MKKLLILGGINLHSKVVLAAKEMGYFTGVVDYLSPNDSPAKMISDAHYEINVFDTKSIIDLCKNENYTGVLNTHIDPCQSPYTKGKYAPYPLQGCGASSRYARQPY